MSWQIEMATDLALNIVRFRRQLAQHEPGSDMHVFLSREIVDARRLARRLIGEHEGRVHEAAFPRVIN